MKKNIAVEVSVGLFIILGILSLAYLSIKLGKMEVIGHKGTTIYAEFSSVGGLRKGAPVEIAGVEVGKVKDITLNQDYQAVVKMLIKPGIKIQDDAIAAIKTKGLIGEKFVEITPGASDIILKSGDRLRNTQPPFSFEDAIARFIFGGVKK